MRMPWTKKKKQAGTSDPVINQPPLRERLRPYLATVAAMRGEAKASFAGDVRGVLTVLVDRFRGQFYSFERHECAEIVSLQDTLRTGIERHAPDQTVAEFRARLDQLKQKLRQAFDRILRDKAIDGQERLDAEQELQNRHAEVMEHRRAQLISMTGTPKGQIRRYNWRTAAIVTTCVVIILGLLEALTGFDMFRWAGNSTVAAGASISVVIILMATSYKAAVCYAQMMAYKDAVRSYFNFRGRAQFALPTDAELTPLSSRTRIVGRASLGLFVLATLALLGGRILIALGDPQLGPKAIMGTATLLGIAWAFFLYKLLTAPAYSPEHLERWQEIEDERLAIEAQLRDLAQDAKNIQARIEGAKAGYQQDVQNLVAELQGRQVTLEQGKDQLRVMSLEYNQALDAAKDEWVVLANALLADLQADPATRSARGYTAEDGEQYRRMFEESIRDSLVDSDLLDRVLSFKFAVQLPEEEPVVNFDQLLDEVSVGIPPNLADRARTQRQPRDIMQIPFMRRGG